MKTLEIILRLIDKLLTEISFRKAQNARDKLSSNPSDWFSEHFAGGVSDTKPKADKTPSASDTTD